MGRQVWLQPSQGEQGFITRNGYLGRQMLSLQMSPPSVFSPQIYTLCDIIWDGASLGSAVPAVSPPGFLCPPSLLTAGAA